MCLADRIKEVRKRAGERQSQFAENLGVKEATVTSWETGARNPSEAVMINICNKYNVNEEWLRTGDGEMSVPITRDEEIEIFIGKMLRDEPDSFKKRLISVLAKLSESEWEVLEEKLKEIVGVDEKKEG